MNITVFLILFLGHFLAIIQSDVITESNKSDTIINGTFSNFTSRQDSGKPIVLHTQIQHYDQPTLRDYQECYEKLTKCKNICEAVDNSSDCVKQCPVCPVLIKEKIVVQGVNDTNFRAGGLPAVNTTNIIRLTNEIHNIIKSQRGNITHNNDHVVNIFQNISRVGGKFGLGYNNTDPCCIILSFSKTCNTRRFSTSAHCHRRRHRVCSRKCSSRVMLAKRITVCEKGAIEDENEDYIDEICYETVKYVPYHIRKRHKSKFISKCAPSPAWPYIKCSPHNNGHYKQSICRRCHSLTYQYVLHRGIPAQCSRCFMTHVRPYYEVYPMWQPDFISRNINYGVDYEDDLDLDINGWRNDRFLCRLPNGEISENCSEHDKINIESPISTTDPLNTWVDVTPSPQDEYVDGDYYDDSYEQITRTQRHAFNPSKYSRRHRLL